MDNKKFKSKLIKRFDIDLNLHLINATGLCFDKCQVIEDIKENSLNSNQKECVKKCSKTCFKLMLTKF